MVANYVRMFVIVVGLVDLFLVAKYGVVVARVGSTQGSVNRDGRLWLIVSLFFLTVLAVGTAYNTIGEDVQVWRLPCSTAGVIALSIGMWFTFYSKGKA